MKKCQIFIGNIRKCTRFDRHVTFSSSTHFNGKLVSVSSIGYTDTDDELYKENAILIKFGKYGYVDVDNLRSILDYIKVYGYILKDGYRLGGLMMSTSAYGNGCLFVDIKSLKPYYDNQEQVSDITLLQVRKLRR